MDGHTGHMRRAATTALALAAIGLGSGTAHAQDVFIDPDSPSGKEYAIPLESARRGADPGREPGAKVVQGQRSSPLFGAGVTARSASAGKKKATTRGETPAASAPSASAPSTPTKPPVTPAVREAIRTAGAPADGGSGLLIAGGAVLLVAAGAGAGLLARRRS